MNRNQQSNAPSKDLYALLEISKTANDDEIKRAYKKAALKHHPDRNHDNKEAATAKFQEISNAFKTLGDPEKRQRYDQFGVIDGEDSGGGGGMPGGFNPFDLFQNMFGGGGMPGGMPGMGGMRMQQSSQNNNIRGPDKKITVNLTLSDVYKGKSINIDFNKVICCDKCEGSGALNKDCIKTCKDCNGQGRIVRMMQMGPMIQQTVQPCGKCAGKGKSVEQGKECIKCKGSKSTTIQRHLDCYVKEGSAAGNTVTFKGESDWVPECSNNNIGDLIVFINSKNEEGVFRREGDNLIMKKSITLLEALTKTVFYFKHLDDRVIKITHNEIIKPNQKMLIENEGMPNVNDMSERGDLIIYFDIIFPSTIEPDRSKYLVKILPMYKKQIWDLQYESMPKEEITELEMKHIDENDESHNTSNDNKQKNGKNNNNGNNGNIFEEDNGERMGFGGGQPVECATQ